MTRVFLAAGVAALAIAAPASARPGGHDGNRVEKAQRGGGQQTQRAQRSDQRTQRVEQRAQRAPRVERQQFAQRAERHEARPQRAERVQRAERTQRVERQARAERRQAPQRVERQARVERRQAPQRVERQARAERQQVRQQRVVERQRVQPNRVERIDTRQANRDQLRLERQRGQQQLQAQRQEIRGDRQMATRNLLAERHALRADRIANANLFRTSRIARTLEIAPRTRFIEPARAVTFVGEPIRTVDNYVTLAALPSSVSYLYPATSNYYYQYGGGYLYQVDRSTSLIAALIPLLAGGILPGTYLPQPYMSSYVPSYYGLNSFYPASYGYNYGAAYGYGYPNICNRYAYGNVYQVDCVTGMVVNVIPMYAGGYGVGQMLPSAYSYYNVPMQYRSLYYPTADYSYWYAPGAIYQYDTGSSMITSVAALMSPGFSVGQPIPVGYNYYNVPMAYRATYYDTPNAWYRYNNGYIYQVDPSTMLVTAIVASLLT